MKLPRPPYRQPRPRPRFGLARALSKLGFCSRSQAAGFIREGRVQVNGAVCPDPERPVDLARDRLTLDGRPVQAARKIYLMLNKPRGLVTTMADEKGRRTVFECLAGKAPGFVAPVGRLDQASEGLLLFTNDTAWAAGLTDPEVQVEKTYHVQVDCLADEPLADKMKAGVRDAGELLVARRVKVLRRGQKNSWLEVVLDEGRNRHIRRLLAALGVGVLRLVRVAIGPLQLGPLAKGQWRLLAEQEVQALRRSPPTGRAPERG